ncbi:MAG: 50S ribosomal protein L18 [Bacteroidales bacterium]|nr:50S ribosomal protein L18 [Bacteroidales bacterium]
MALSKRERRNRIKLRIRNKIIGTQECPRMTVFRSNKNISVQIINDTEGKTLVSTSSLIKEISEKKDINKIKQAEEVGKLIAKIAIEKGIKTVVFDRNGCLYHGRIKALAEAARKGGIKF